MGSNLKCSCQWLHKNRGLLKIELPLIFHILKLLRQLLNVFDPVNFNQIFRVRIKGKI